MFLRGYKMTKIEVTKQPSRTVGYGHKLTGKCSYKMARVRNDCKLYYTTLGL